MVASCKALWSNPNFILKFAVIVLAVVVTILTHPYSYDYMVAGYHQSCIIVVLSLLITYIFFESTKITELCLLTAALVKLIAATVIYIINRHRYHIYDTVNKPAGDEQTRKLHPPPSAQQDSYVAADSNVSYVYAEPDNTQYIMYLALNIVTIVLIVVDIVLRSKK